MKLDTEILLERRFLDLISEKSIVEMSSLEVGDLLKELAQDTLWSGAQDPCPRDWIFDDLKPEAINIDQDQLTVKGKVYWLVGGNSHLDGKILDDFEFIGHPHNGVGRYLFRFDDDLYRSKRQLRLGRNHQYFASLSPRDRRGYNPISDEFDTLGVSQ